MLLKKYHGQKIKNKKQQQQEKIIMLQRTYLRKARRNC